MAIQVRTLKFEGEDFQWYYVTLWNDVNVEPLLISSGREAISWERTNLDYFLW